MGKAAKGDAVVDGGYREQELRELCHECGESASFSCVDCKQPRCDEHRDTQGPRCLACATERRCTLAATAAGIASLLGGGALVVLFFFAPPSTVALILLWAGLLGQISGVVLALASGLRSSRRARLAQGALFVSILTLPSLVLLTFLG